MSTEKSVTLLVEALIAEVRELDAKATPGPWWEYLDNSKYTVDQDGLQIGILHREQDAAFIARSRTLLAQLADACEDLSNGYAAQDIEIGRLADSLERAQTLHHEATCALADARSRELLEVRRADEACAALEKLTKGKDLGDGTYQPSLAEMAQSDREERDYWQERAAEARAELAQAAKRYKAALEAIAYDDFPNGSWQQMAYRALRPAKGDSNE